MGQNPRSQSERRHRHSNLLAPLPSVSEDGLFELLDRLEGPPFLLILDQVQDPHNLGACLRTAEAAGVMAVIAPRDHSVAVTDIVRTTACGAAEKVPYVQVTNLARFMDQLKERGIWLVGTIQDAPKSIFTADLKGPLGIVMGSEGSGIRRLTSEKCDFLVKIPMAGTVESLNVSVATGVALFEALRQRMA